MAKVKRSFLILGVLILLFALGLLTLFFFSNYIGKIDGIGTIANTSDLNLGILNTRVLGDVLAERDITEGHVFDASSGKFVEVNEIRFEVSTDMLTKEANKEVTNLKWMIDGSSVLVASSVARVEGGVLVIEVSFPPQDQVNLNLKQKSAIFISLAFGKYFSLNRIFTDTTQGQRNDKLEQVQIDEILSEHVFKTNSSIDMLFYPFIVKSL